jgi:SAM-dependent methyltransferase/uncharacterized protein YbaR (Trm112 family)
MTEDLLKLLRCPVTRSGLVLEIISSGKKKYFDGEEEIVENGILYAGEDWFFPVINGIPRLTVEAFLDYEYFLIKHEKNYIRRKEKLLAKNKSLLNYAVKKNKRTKKSFELEWKLFNYEEDKTWSAGKEKMIERFLAETSETRNSLNNKLILDAGCGNGLLTQLIAQCGASVVGMDLSVSVESAFKKNNYKNVFFIQGDVQYPPVNFNSFDMVHASGVLICTNNSELSFSRIDPCVKKGGKLSVWLYHPRKNMIHNFFNLLRKITSKLPLTIQYYLYFCTLFPLTFIIKKIKGSKQNKREIMIEIVDWFSPEFRWEHTHEEAEEWFRKRNYTSIAVTTNELFGFNIIGVKN